MFSWIKDLRRVLIRQFMVLTACVFDNLNSICVVRFKDVSYNIALL